MAEQSSDVSKVFSPRRSGPIFLGAGALGLLLAGATMLWMHYGTAVFFEMIRTGFAACFG